MKRNLLIYFMITIAAMSCAQHAEKEAVSEIAPLANASTNGQLAQFPTKDVYSDGKTKLIKVARYRFEVEDLKRSTDAIIEAVKKYPAYVSTSNFHLENSIRESNMTIRVQNEYFSDLMNEIDGQAKFVNYRDVSTDDVSKDFVDLESRLKTKREVEGRYMTILRNKAGTIEELLEAERQIGILHEEIEATISRINHLREQISYSTINVEFYQDIANDVTAESSPMGQKFLEAFRAGWDGVLLIVIAVTYAWPLLVVAILTLTLYKIRKSRMMV